MSKKYRLCLVLFALVAGLAVVVQGCGNSTTATTHTIYGSTS